jgi:hypothetical protein
MNGPAGVGERSMRGGYSPAGFVFQAAHLCKLRAVTGMLRLFLGMLCLLVPARAHVVTQIFGEWKEAEPWEVEVLFDAGYAVPEWRGDARAEAPRREWLVGLGEEGWRPLRLEAERYLRECLSVKAGGGVAQWSVEFPDFTTNPPGFPELLNDGAYFRTRIIGAESLKGGTEISWADGLRPSLVLQLPGKHVGYLTLAPGQSTPLPSDGRAVGRVSWVESFRQGFLHVLPMGLDHVLFVMGLFFYRREWRPLLWQSLAFTLAHTVTLGLAAAGVVRVSGAWVEPMIALSLVVVALENLRPVRGGGYRVRLPVVFGFGLIHGLGFAGALAVWLRPGEGFLAALLSANLGVEVAQVVLLASAWCLTAGWHGGPGYQRVRWLGCVGIALTGAFWVLERTGVLAIFQR